MISSTASSPLNSARLHAGQQAVVPEAAVAHDRQRAPLHHRRDAGAAGQAHAVAQDRVARSRTARRCANAWQPMSAAMCTGPMSCCASLSAENTGRSGQPMQKLGGRAGSGCAELRRHRLRAAARLPASQRFAASAAGPGSIARRRTAPGPAAITSTRVLAGRRQQVLAVQRRLDVAPAQAWWRSPARCIRAGLPRPPARARLPAQKSRDLLGHQRVGDVEHQQRDVARAERIGQAELLQRAHQRVVQAALHDDAEVVVLAAASAR